MSTDSGVTREEFAEFIDTLLTGYVTGTRIYDALKKFRDSLSTPEPPAPEKPWGVELREYAVGSTFELRDSKEVFTFHSLGKTSFGSQNGIRFSLPSRWVGLYLEGDLNNFRLLHEPAAPEPKGEPVEKYRGILAPEPEKPVSFKVGDTVEVTEDCRTAGRQSLAKGMQGVVSGEPVNSGISDWEFIHIEFENGSAGNVPISKLRLVNPQPVPSSDAERLKRIAEETTAFLDVATHKGFGLNVIELYCKRVFALATGTN